MIDLSPTADSAVADQKASAEDADGKSADDPGVLSGAVGRSMEGRGRGRRGRELEVAEGREGGNGRAIAGDVEPEPVDGVVEVGEVGGGSGERLEKVFLDRLQILFHCLHGLRRVAVTHCDAMA